MLKDKKLILASGSPRRIEMMAQHGLTPRIMPAHVEENLPVNSGMCETAMFLALKKAQAVEAEYFAEGGEGDAGAEGGAGGAGGTSCGAGDAGENQGGDQGAAGSSMSFDDYLKDPKNQAEFDRRVSKALETNRTKMQADIEKQIADAKTEAEKMAKMNADQKAQYEREKQEKELADREAAITKRELTATAKEQLAEKGLPISLAAILNYTNAEECAASIDAVGKAFQEAVEKAVTDRLAGGKPPKKADGATAYTMDQIRNMSADEINKNWDAVQAAMKSN